MPMRPPRWSERGLTLTELLVAAALAGLVLASIFGILTNTARAFRVQTDYSQTMDRLNLALDTVKNDLRRASYLSIPNTNVPFYPNLTSVCGNPLFAPQGLHGIVMANNGASYQPDPLDQITTGRFPDQMLLLGAYRTSEIFVTQQAAAGSGTLQVSTNGLTVAQLTTMFRGSIVALRNRKGGVQFLRVVDNDNAVTDVGGLGALANITLQAGDTVRGIVGPGTDQCLFTGVQNAGMDVIPLHYVRYDVVVDAELRGPALIREELTWNDTVLSRYVVARNVADFQAWFDRTNTAVGQIPSIEVDGAAGLSVIDDDNGTQPWPNLRGEAASRTEQTRYGYVQLSVRLDTPIPGLQAGDGSGGIRDNTDLLRFDAAGQPERSGERTRVLTARTEVELTNIGLSDL